MKNLLRYSLLALAITLAASTSAHAEGIIGEIFGGLFGPPPPPSHKNPPSTHTGPEVDPGMAITGFSLLAGTLTIMRTRRAKE
jgi:hypothetical protein